MSDRSELPARQMQTVLIIDADCGTRATIGRYVRLEGYHVFLASTGREGINEAARVSPEAILLDYHLPDVDGLTCLRALRREKSLIGTNVGCSPLNGTWK